MFVPTMHCLKIVRASFCLDLLYVPLAYHIFLNKVNGDKFFPLRVNLIFGNNQMSFKVHSSEHAVEVCKTSFSQ